MTHTAAATARRATLYTVLTVGLVVSVLPLVWALSSSVKPVADIFTYPPRLLPGHPTTANYSNLFTHFAFFRWLGNSLGVSIVVTAGTVFFSMLGGYAFAKYRFPGQRFLFDVMFSSMLIPFAVILVPLFAQITRLGWGNSYLALTVPWLAPAFGVFMMRQFVLQSVPDEMIEAARVDGCGEFSAFLRVVVPILRPAMGALGVWTFLNSYNNFLWPLVVLSSQDKFTLPLGLNTLVSGYGREYGLVMAASVLAAIPTIVAFLILRRQLIDGLTIGSVKG